MATFYQNAPGQQQGQAAGHYPGPFPAQYPGQPPVSVPSSFAGHGPYPGQPPVSGPGPTGIRPGMPYMGHGYAGMQGFYTGQVPYPGGQGQPRMQGQGKQGQPQIPSQGEGHPRGQFQMPYVQGFPPFIPFGAMGPGQGFPMPPKPGEDARKTQGRGEDHNEPGPPGYPFMQMPPWGPIDPRMFAGMFQQGQPHDTDQQPHSGPPPPYNGSTLAQPDRPLHDSQTAQKVVPDVPKLSELKEPLVGPVGKGMLPGQCRKGVLHFILKRKVTCFEMLLFKKACHCVIVDIFTLLDNSGSQN